MYLPEHFRETRVEVMHDLIRTRPLGTLVTATADGLEANHIPFEIDPQPIPFGTLRGHVSRSNPIREKLSDTMESLVIFQGTETYVSPSWYPSKLETGKVVPTWNYVVVHAYGALKFIEDNTWLRKHIEELTNRHESNQTNPWKVSDAPEDYIEKMLEGITGMEITVTRLVGKWKTSQNRPAKDRAGVIQALAGLDSDSAREMAELVRAGGTGDV